MTTSRLVLITNNENGDNVILQELGNDLQSAFKAFNEMDLEELDEENGFTEFELVKYDEDNTAQDWTDEELNSIDWPLNTWVTKSK